MTLMGGVSRVDFAGKTLIDLTNDNVSPDTLLYGVHAHNAAGEEIMGTVRAKTTTATLTVAGWTQGSDGLYAQSVSVSDVTADTAIVIVQGDLQFVEPDVAQGNGTLTFYATSIPTAAIALRVGIPV